MIYVVEINGRGIVALADKTLVEEGYFKADLLSLQSEGKALWNGQDTLTIRDAFPEEQEQWRASHARSVRNEEYDNDGDPDDWVCFLVPIDAHDDDLAD